MEPAKKEWPQGPKMIATTSKTHADDSANPTKIASILTLFVKGRSLNRFDAENYHDHCLHSTVSRLQDWGLRIDRHWERVPCLRGRAQVRVKRYWLSCEPDNLAVARNLLKSWEARYG